MKKKPTWEWPNGKRIAVVFNVCLEAWSDGKAPGTSARWATHCLRVCSIQWRSPGPPMDGGRHPPADGGLRAPWCQGERDGTNAVIAERAPATVKAIADNGHEVLSHSYAMDVIPGAPVRRGREEKYRTLHRAAGKDVRPENRRLAIAARHLEADNAEAARRSRLSAAVWRRVPHRLALRGRSRQQADRRHSAVLRRQRHAIDGNTAIRRT